MTIAVSFFFFFEYYSFLMWQKPQKYRAKKKNIATQNQTFQKEKNERREQKRAEKKESITEKTKSQTSSY